MQKQPSYRLPRLFSAVSAFVALGALIAVCRAIPEQTFSRNPALLLTLFGLFAWFAFRGDRPGSRDRMLIAWVCGAAGGLISAVLAVPAGAWALVATGYYGGGQLGFVLGATIGAVLAQALRTASDPDNAA
ncbi:MAG: hypothetical protein AAF581_10320 [Planctomycetota bacterium]